MSIHDPRLDTTRVVRPQDARAIQAPLHSASAAGDA